MTKKKYRCSNLKKNGGGNPFEADMWIRIGRNDIYMFIFYQKD